jgi:hypothetical protein
MTGTDTRRELMHRTSNGIDVALFWSEVGNELELEVHDAKDGESWVLSVPKDRALDAFHHPYAYVSVSHSAACRRARSAA